MGAWSTGSFGNDAALDFVEKVAGPPDVAALLTLAARADSGMDADLASAAIAAADCVALTLGRPAPDTPPDLLARFADFPMPDDALLGVAATAVGKVRDNSELAALWAEDDPSEWLAEIDALLRRLDPTHPYERTFLPEIEPADIGHSCLVCGRGITQDALVTVNLEGTSGGVWLSIEQYAHRDCLILAYRPPHFQDNGEMHPALVKELMMTFEIDTDT